MQPLEQPLQDRRQQFRVFAGRLANYCWRPKRRTFHRIVQAKIHLVVTVGPRIKHDQTDTSMSLAEEVLANGSADCTLIAIDVGQGVLLVGMPDHYSGHMTSGEKQPRLTRNANQNGSH